LGPLEECREAAISLPSKLADDTSAQRLDVKLRAAGRRPASSGALLAACPIMPVQVARRRANSRRGSRLGRREKRRRTANFNGELGSTLHTNRVLTLGPPNLLIFAQECAWRNTDADVGCNVT